MIVLEIVAVWLLAAFPIGVAVAQATYGAMARREQRRG